MLVALSDLHFTDGTAGEHNLSDAAFRNVFLSSVLSLLRRKKATELKVVFLGDIVDLIRSEQWFDEEMDDRPWGENGLKDIEQPAPGSKTEARCLKILGEIADPPGADTIASKNARTFEFFREELAEKVRETMGGGFPLKIIYVTGNHDRLCNLYPSVRDRLQKLLGLTVTNVTVEGDPAGDWWYLNEYRDEAYAFLGRHGHQHDYWNYGNLNIRGREGHLQACIGDVFTTEFAVKIPYTVRRMKAAGTYPDLDDSFLESLKEIDNVRPLSSVLDWLYYRVRNAGDYQAALDEAFDSIIKDILKIKFVQKWRSPHTRMDEALRAAGSRFGRWLSGSLLDRTGVESILPLILSKTGTPDDPAKDRYTEGAYREEAWKDLSTINHIVYGHTHVPLVRPLDRIGSREIFYINTGTWRDRIYKTVPFDRNPDFIGSKSLTYVVFYGADEDPGKQPGTVGFDVWSGTKIKKYTP